MTQDISSFSSNVLSFPEREKPLFPEREKSLVDKTFPWWNLIQNKMGKFICLPENWDGHGGRPTRFQCAYFAMHILEVTCSPTTPEPSIVPCANGGLQIEWHINGYDIEIYVEKPNKIYAWRGTLEDEEGEECNLTTDFTRIAHWVNEISYQKPSDAQSAA